LAEGEFFIFSLLAESRAFGTLLVEFYAAAFSAP
jgi:hypothetical protein